MLCKNCGKALSNSQPTCPFCGSFIDQSQLEAYKEMKKEQSRDLRPKLISERYGQKPYQYEKLIQTNNRLIVVLAFAGVIVIVFVILIFFFF